MLSILRIYNQSMTVLTFVLGELQTNCYLIFEDATKRGLIIDPADDANFISEQVLQNKITPTAIIATHGHFDHLLAANELQMAFKIPFYIHPKDLFLVKDLQKNSSFWLKRKIMEKPPLKIQFFNDRVEPCHDTEIFSLALSPWVTDDKVKPCQPKEVRPPGGRTSVGIEIIHTPGHTPGSVCFYFPQQGILFTGDTLFADGVGRTDLPYSSTTQLASSLKKLSKLPPETKIYPGHGNYGIVFRKTIIGG